MNLFRRMDSLLLEACRAAVLEAYNTTYYSYNTVPDVEPPYPWCPDVC
jgi:hypothetical protein